MEGENQTDLQVFKRKLKHLYKKIDSVSSLLWSHENHVTGKRLRSEINSEDTKLKWMNKETTQTGYGEIAMGSMTSLFNLMQNISKFIKVKISSDEELEESLIYSPEEYNMTKDSLFLDIGSGFGKPVFHSALQVGCKSKGIEVVPARVEFCIDFFYEFMDNKNFFDELEKKIANKQGNKSDDEDVTISLGKGNLTTAVNEEVLNGNQTLAKSSKIKIYHNEDGSSYVDCEVAFVNTLDLNSLNSSYFQQTLDDKSSNLFLELQVNKEIVFDDSLCGLVIHKQNFYSINKSLLIEDITEPNTPILKFGKFFKYDQIEVDITPIDDHIYSNLVKTLSSSIYTDTIDREIFFECYLSRGENLRKISDLVQKVENIRMLELIFFVNSIFKGKNDFLDTGFLKNYFITSNDHTHNHNSNHTQIQNHSLHNSFPMNGNKSSKSSKQKNFSNINTNMNSNNSSNNVNAHLNNTVSNFTNDLYEELKKELVNRDKIFQELLEGGEEETDLIKKNDDKELQTLKEILVDLKFAPYNDRWPYLTSFISEDATKYKAYSEDDKNKTHFTHIYAYNKLMSKECRSKIAKILNKTKFKILAWYSNPKQTKNAGLKNFTFLCKFPMQSTSTEKFHVYVYIKTK